MLEARALPRSSSTSPELLIGCEGAGRCPAERGRPTEGRSGGAGTLETREVTVTWQSEGDATRAYSTFGPKRFSHPAAATEPVPRVLRHRYSVLITSRALSNKGPPRGDVRSNPLRIDCGHACSLEYLFPANKHSVSCRISDGGRRLPPGRTAPAEW